MRQVIACGLFALAILAPAAVQGQGRVLDAADEAAKDASWADFKKQLFAALEKRDRKFVLGILDPGVRSGLEGGRGVPEFAKQWQLDSEASPVWQALSSALVLPGAYHQPATGPMELCVPYVSVRWPQDVDAFSGGAITAGAVAVKSAPSAASDTVTTLAYHMVEVADWEVDDRAADSKQKWVKIKLKEGEGYVPEEQVRSPIEHAACFVKGGGGWRLVGFGPGGGK